MTARERAEALWDRLREECDDQVSLGGLDVIEEAIRSAEAAAYERAARECDAYRAERDAALERFPDGDERRVWLACKASEAERCANRIRALKETP